MERECERSFQVLRLTYGAVPIVAGLDKFTNFLTDWSQYLSKPAVAALPVPPRTFMKMVGIVEMGAGIMVLAKPRVGGWLTSAWLLSIAANLIAGGYYDIAVRDVAMSIGAGTLAQLAAAREPDTQRKPQARLHRQGLPGPMDATRKRWAPTSSDRSRIGEFPQPVG